MQQHNLGSLIPSPATLSPVFNSVPTALKLYILVGSRGPVHRFSSTLFTYVHYTASGSCIRASVSSLLCTRTPLVRPCIAANNCPQAATAVAAKVGVDERRAGLHITGCLQCLIAVNGTLLSGGRSVRCWMVRTPRAAGLMSRATATQKTQWRPHSGLLYCLMSHTSPAVSLLHD